jgi:hypothetical protein
VALTSGMPDPRFINDTEFERGAKIPIGTVHASAEYIFREAGIEEVEMERRTGSWIVGVVIGFFGMYVSLLRSRDGTIDLGCARSVLALRKHVWPFCPSQDRAVMWPSQRLRVRVMISWRICWQRNRDLDRFLFLLSNYYNLQQPVTNYSLALMDTGRQFWTSAHPGFDSIR